jgi:hypothetical protein
VIDPLQQDLTSVEIVVADLAGDHRQNWRMRLGESAGQRGHHHADAVGNVALPDQRGVHRRPGVLVLAQIDAGRKDIVHQLGEQIDRAVLPQQQRGIGGEDRRDSNHALAPGADLQTEPLDFLEVQQGAPGKQHAHGHAIGQGDAVGGDLQRHAQGRLDIEHARGAHRGQLAQAISVDHAGPFEPHVEELFEQADLGQLHGHQQRNRLVVRLERRFLVAPHAVDEIDLAAHGIGADLAGDAQIAFDNRPKSRMGEQFGAAAQVGHVVPAKRVRSDTQTVHEWAGHERFEPCRLKTWGSRGEYLNHTSGSWAFYRLFARETRARQPCRQASGVVTTNRWQTA